MKLLDRKETQCDFYRNRPDIASKDDLRDLCEIQDIETGAIIRSTFSFVDVNDTVWFGQVSGVRKYDLTVEDIRDNISRIPDDTVYPKVTSDLTILADDAHMDGLYIKRPKFLSLDNAEETQLLPSMLFEEAYTLESLKCLGNKHLVRYHRCLQSEVEWLVWPWRSMTRYCSIDLKTTRGILTFPLALAAYE